jgi:hypothetical protein
MGMILCWNKPEKAMSTDAWRNNAGFDGGPPGGYVPNMSEEDTLKWRAKLVGKKGGIKQVEIRKSTSNGTQMLIIVSEGGFRQKVDRWHPDGVEFPGKNVRISLNGPAALSFKEMEELHRAIEEAREALK